MMEHWNSQQILVQYPIWMQCSLESRSSLRHPSLGEEALLYLQSSP